LAQYRELASFSQFGSDVDKDTKTRLDHGIILMETIKQRQYHPLPVEHQVMLFYAAVNKYMDDMKPSDVAGFEKGLYEHMDAVHPSVGKSIADTGELSSDAEEELREGIVEFKKDFVGGDI
jgi:F-type H+-transporting ATPase subunit alpha